MPRATPVPDTEETVPAPKRVRRAPRKKTLETEVVNEADSAVESIGSPAAPRRKAPARRVAAPAPAPATAHEAMTTASAQGAARPRRSGRLQVVVVLGVLIIGVGASAVIGLSDKGKIDVAARIQEQSQLLANQTGGEGGQSQTIPVQNTPVNVPNGGLTPAGAATPPPPPPPEPATTTASSTEATASTTPETSDAESPPDTAAATTEAASDAVTAEPALAP